MSSVFSNSYRVNAFLIILFTLTGCMPATVKAQDDAAGFVATLIKARELAGAQKWAESLKYWKELTLKNPVNGEYWANYARATYNSKDYRESIEAYKKQIELGYGRLEIAAYNIACDYALLGEKAPALDWLQKAFDMGFKSYTNPTKDDDLAILRNDPQYNKILGIADFSKMTRVDSWKFDMDILKREVLRKFVYRRGLSLDEFNRQYDALYNSIDKKTDIEVVLAMKKMMVALDDGHTSLFPPFTKTYMSTLPVMFYQFQEGLYIVAADPAYKNLLGAKVLGINNKTTEQAAALVEPYISRDNQMGVVENIPQMLRSMAVLNTVGITPGMDKADLQLMGMDGKQFSATLTPDTLVWRVEHKLIPSNWVTLAGSINQPVPNYLKNLKTTYWFETLPGTNTVYWQFNNVLNDKAESLANFTDRLFKYIEENKTEKLIIDIRFNNGGNTALLPYLMNTIIRSDRINKRGNLYVIIGRRTFSAAQNFATYMERQTNSIFIGEPTESRPNFVGEEDFVTLPYSKVNINVSDLYWVSSWPTDHRMWIAPMIYLPPTFKSYSQNKDDVLDTIIQLTKKQF